MATLQVRDIDDRLYNYLKTSARLQNRSISQEVITIIEAYLNTADYNFKNATQEFLLLTGAWQDDRSAETIVADLRSSRGKSSRFGEKSGIFERYG